MANCFYCKEPRDNTSLYCDKCIEEGKHLDIKLSSNVVIYDKI